MDPEGGGGGGGGRGSGLPLKNHKNIGFLSNTGPDSLKITKLSSQHLMLGHHWHATPSTHTKMSELDPLWLKFLDPPMGRLDSNLHGYNIGTG